MNNVNKLLKLTSQYNKIANSSNLFYKTANPALLGAVEEMALLAERGLIAEETAATLANAARAGAIEASALTEALSLESNVSAATRLQQLEAELAAARAGAGEVAVGEGVAAGAAAGEGEAAAAAAGAAEPPPPAPESTPAPSDSPMPASVEAEIGQIVEGDLAARPPSSDVPISSEPPPGRFDDVLKDRYNPRTGKIERLDPKWLDSTGKLKKGPNIPTLKDMAQYVRGRKLFAKNVKKLRGQVDRATMRLSALEFVKDPRTIAAAGAIAAIVGYNWIFSGKKPQSKEATGLKRKTIDEASSKAEQISGTINAEEGSEKIQDLITSLEEVKKVPTVTEKGRANLAKMISMLTDIKTALSSLNELVSLDDPARAKTYMENVKRFEDKIKTKPMVLPKFARALNAMNQTEAADKCTEVGEMFATYIRAIESARSMARK